MLRSLKMMLRSPKLKLGSSKPSLRSTKPKLWRPKPRTLQTDAEELQTKAGEHQTDDEEPQTKAEEHQTEARLLWMGAGGSRALWWQPLCITCSSKPAKLINCIASPAWYHTLKLENKVLLYQVWLTSPPHPLSFENNSTTA